MSKKPTTTTTTTTTATVKRFTKTARLSGGAGAMVKVNLREGKTGGFNLSTTLKQPGEKTATGCTMTVPDRDAALVEFDKLVAVALAHGWIKKEQAVRVPKAPAFTVETFPTATVPVAGGGLTVPKGKKTGKK
jgi:hypothetical protein